MEVVLAAAVTALASVIVALIVDNRKSHGKVEQKLDDLTDEVRDVKADVRDLKAEVRTYRRRAHRSEPDFLRDVQRIAR